MNKISIKRLFTMALLMLVSMSAWADVKVVFGENGSDSFEGTGGKIAVAQEISGTDVTVTLTVTPDKDKGYTISKSDIEVYATIASGGTRTPEIASTLELKGDDPTDLSDERKYTVSITPNFGVWVKKVSFTTTNRKSRELPIWTDGVYYLKSTVNTTNPWYLWPSVVTNTESGNRYVTTYQGTAVPAESGKYDAHDNTWCHWVVKNVTVGENAYIQIINPKLDKYIIIYDKSLLNASFQNKPGFGDRDIWLSSIPEDETRSYFKLTNKSGDYYRISPTQGYNNQNVSDFANRSFNSAGSDQNGLGTGSGGTALTDQRQGLIQLYNGDPKWTVVADLLPAPTIHYDEDTHLFTIEYDKIPPGFDILYTTNGNDPTIGGTDVHTYTGETGASESCTVKAVVARYGVVLTSVASQAVDAPGTPPDPVITPSDDCNSINAVIITSAGASIYYTTDGTEPSKTNGTLYTGPFLQNNNSTIKAVSYYGNNSSDNITTYNYTAHTLSPYIVVSGNLVTITGSGNIYYTLTGVEPDETSEEYRTPFTLADGSGTITIKAVAKEKEKLLSCISVVTAKQALFISNISDLNRISANDDCILTADIIDASSFTTSISDFTGSFEAGVKADGSFFTISGLTKPLFATTNGAVIKNVMLKEVNIAQSGSVGALVGEAEGNTLIYNCGILPTDNNEESTNPSEIKSTDGYCGGIVGWLKDNSRVINCFSYANITGGTYVGGIVGYNNYASKSNDIHTMVMNCMFYGDITAAGDKAPIYNGSNIANYYTSDSDRGLNNYNYFRFDKPYVSSIDHYNCALGAEDRYLDRFEFFRHTLNSNRELAAWYITGNADDGKGDGNIMAKWVVDKSIAPYPILKPQGTYPSVVNHDAANAADIGDEAENHNQGRKFGSLTVIISLGSNAPTGAGIKADKSSISLNITDKNTAHYDFNYRKVQLPYYNEVGTGNYTHNKVVTGWKITDFTGGTPGSFSTGVDAPAYNFVDRNCTNKDLYGTGGSNRVFSQGAYYEVPDGVTGISIEAYWADCTYLADAGLDVTYNTGYNTESQSAIAHYTNGSTYSINGDNQAVYTSFDNALTALGDTWTGNVYDKAIVLVGNYHKNFGASAPGGDVVKPLTVMSADLNFDNEPDYCLFYAHEQRRNVTPIRFDFITMPSIGLAMKASGSSKYVQAGIFRPKGWFEITNTALIRFSQFEYSYKDSKTIASPLILMGGIYEQFVSTNQDGHAGNTTYLHLGGNAWFKEFNNGCHTNQPKKTPKVPISVSGGDFDKFYLSGVYRPNVTPDAENAECYIDGGRFGEVAGAGMQLINGNVTWLINGADIENFYGGGINEAKSITGNISTTISNSWVGNFYGGPKFGNMASGKEVTSIATDCHFDNFFGAGYGGNAYNRVGKKDESPNVTNVSADTWNGYITSEYNRAYDSGNGGIGASFDYEYLIHSNFSYKVARFYVNYASLSLATTRTTTSTLTRCTINKNFYGGGSLGSVNGDVTSTLTDCTVEGSAFGAGFSATTPTIDVMPESNFVVPPSYDYNAGVFNDEHVEFPASVTYTWSDDATKFNLSSSYFKDDGDTHLIYTSTPLSDLGRVIGKVTLNIAGSTTVAGDVYGGGESSNVTGNTTVNILP